MKGKVGRKKKLEMNEEIVSLLKNLVEQSLSFTEISDKLNSRHNINVTASTLAKYLRQIYTNEEYQKIKEDMSGSRSLLRKMERAEKFGQLTKHWQMGTVYCREFSTLPSTIAIHAYEGIEERSDWINDNALDVHIGDIIGERISYRYESTDLTGQLTAFKVNVDGKLIFIGPPKRRQQAGTQFWAWKAVVIPQD